MTRTISLLLLLAALASACGGDPSLHHEPGEGVPPDTAPGGSSSAHEPPGDGAGTLMMAEIPLGTYYEEVRRRVAGLGELEPELEDSADELTEARTTMHVLGYDADVEFNFRNDTLYSYYFHVDADSCGDAVSLYSDIIEFYRDAFGRPQTEAEDEGDYAWEAASWALPAEIRASKVAATLGRQGDNCRVGWGFD